MFHRGGAERVARGEHDLALFLGEAAGELTDRGRLSRAIHADYQDYERLPLFVNHERACARCEDLGYRRSKSRDERRDIGEFIPRYTLLEAGEDVLGRFDSDVGAQQTGLELLQGLRVDLAAAEQLGEIVGQPGIALIQARLRRLKKPWRSSGFCWGASGF